MEKLHCFRGQFDSTLTRFVYEQPPEGGPKEQGEKKEALKKTPERKEEIKAKYDDDNLEKVTSQKAKEVLDNPGRLFEKLSYMEENLMRPKNMRSVRPEVRHEDSVREMLDAVKTDTAFLKKVISTYADKVASQYGYVCSNAIKRINLVDDKFFISVFEKSKDYHIRSEAVRKIKDQAYLKNVAEEYRKKGNIGSANEGAVALEGITDQTYLRTVALDEKADNFMRERALSKSTDKALLQQFASIPDREADQYYVENGERLYSTPESFTVPFHKGILRATARDRLAE